MISTRSSRCWTPRSSCTWGAGCAEKGIEAARVWATREPGGVQQTIALDELLEEGLESGDSRAVALIRRAWHWEEDGGATGEDEMAWVFALRDRRVRSWRPYEDRAEALRAGGFPEPGRRRRITCTAWPTPHQRSR